MSAPSSPSPSAPVLPLPRRGVTKRSVNLSLSPGLVNEAARVANVFYHTTLSGLTERTLTQIVARCSRRKAPKS